MRLAGAEPRQKAAARAPHHTASQAGYHTMPGELPCLPKTSAPHSPLGCEQPLFLLRVGR